MTPPPFNVSIDRDIDALTCVIPFVKGQLNSLRHCNIETYEKYLDRVAAKFRSSVSGAIQRRYPKSVG